MITPKQWLKRYDKCRNEFFKNKKVVLPQEIIDFNVHYIQLIQDNAKKDKQ